MINVRTRRDFLKLASIGFAVTAAGPAWSQKAEPATDLKPGEWLWYPERSLYGPVTVIVSLSDQLAFVYRNGIRIGVTTVSSGRPGFETPTGVFMIFKKEKLHLSKKYDNAPMPDSQFFFGGAALHAGGLPGYPSSHGCVHLPTEFAALLFEVTHDGTPVIVTNERSGIGGLSHAGLVMSEQDLKQIEKLAGGVSDKKLAADNAGKNSNFSLLVSGADGAVYGLKDGAILFTSPIGIKNPRKPLGSHVYILQGFDPDRKNFDWLAVGMGTGHEDRVRQQKELAATNRLTIPPDIYATIAQNLHPGSAFMLTDLPAHPATRTGTDFVIMRDRKTS
ncbi:L,D-transpeptidase [Hoeflea prorocentri]|uniref:L,D-transpeptidase n=1 Tax=Hoeflea prorocentri TaxID=1922333 RepID=A0A9X3UI45_9HYPH|nr:L,D-transpeptidase [Hoeflea prorocentri]MCY6381082.1 L,D-transpeptidase [Hoeflea prorocentri]MDA5398882.1 L,D-transpeptidase [Hoeflea prorocentri]